MPEQSKVFSYEVDGLSYTVTVYEQDGVFLADITVLDGSMDVNAVYFGDDDMSGKTASLAGPLNMNGTRLDGEKVQWDDAVALSDPGLGPDGEDKDTYLSTGDTLTISLDVQSLDEIDIFGIRATSTSTDEGSIKGVSSDPEVHEEPEEPEEPEDPLYGKVFFGETFSDDGAPLGGTFILDEEPNPNTFNNVALPEGTEPTFENYLNYFVSDEIGGDVQALQSIVFYEPDENGDLQETFRLDAPEGGFEDTEQVLLAYDDAIDGAEEELEGDPALELMAAISLDPSLAEEPVEFDEATHDAVEDEFEMV